MDNDTKRYKAFISYSHANNREEGRKWADWLHHTLETYEIPEDLVGKKNLHGQEIPRQIFPVFQDEKELSASSNLNTSLTEALDNAEFLIYLSSPRSARSAYVRNEIRHFKQSGKSAKMIALILSGEPEYGQESSDRQCFPDELRYHIEADGQIDYARPEEVLAADVRIPDSPNEGYTSPEAYRRHLHRQDLSGHQIKSAVAAYKKRIDLAILKIIAGILDVPLRELTKRDQAYQLEKAKRKNRNIKRIAVAISTLALLAVLAGIIAWKQKNNAQRSLARSLYTAGINKLTESEYGDGAAYIAEATRQGDKGAAVFAHSMLAMQPDLTVMPNIMASNTRFSPNGRWIAAFANSGANRTVLQIWDASRRRLYRQVDSVKTVQARQPFFDQLDRVYTTGMNSDLFRYDIKDQRLDLIRKNIDSSFLTIKAVAPDGSFLVYTRNKETRLFNTNSKKEYTLYTSNDFTPVEVFFDDQADKVIVSGHLTSYDDVTIFHLDSAGITPVTKLQLHSGTKPPSFSADGSQVVFNNLDGIFYYNLATGSSWKAPQRSYSYRFAAFTKRGLLTAGNEYDIDVFNPANGRIVQSKRLPENLFFTNPFLKQIIDGNTLSTEQTSADYTQQIISDHGQTFIENIKASPLQLHRFYADSLLSEMVPGLAGDHLYVVNKNSPVVEKMDLATGERKKWLTLPEAITFIDLLRKPKVLILKGKSGKTYLYDAVTGKAAGTGFDSQVKSYLFSTDQTEVLARTGPDEFGIWNVQSGKQRLHFKYGQPLAKFTANPDFKTILVVTDDNWKVIDLATKKTIKKGVGHISSGAYNMTGTYMVIINAAGEAVVYETKDYRPILSIKTIEFPFLVFNHGGNVLAISEDDSHMRLWDLNAKKSYGQTVRVSKFSKFFTFSDDDSRIFVQDDGEHLNYVVKIVDAKTGGVLTMPLINQHFNVLEVLQDNRRLLTVEQLIKGYAINIWEMPGLIHIPQEQLAGDLEKFYGKKYDAQTGAVINASDTTSTYHTWYFEDPLTRSISPASSLSITDDIRHNYPIKTEGNLYLLGASYSYHPLARAMMANYFSMRPETAYLAACILSATKKQLEKVKNTSLKNEVAQILQQAETHLNQ